MTEPAPLAAAPLAAPSEPTTDIPAEAPLPHGSDIDCWCKPTRRDDGSIRHQMTAPTEDQTDA